MANDERIDHQLLLQVWERLGPFDIDLMASPANVIADPEGHPIKFYSRYLTQGCLGQDIFAQNLTGKSALYCFPSFNLIGLTLQFLRDSRCECTVILPDIKGSWYSIVFQGKVDQMLLSQPGNKGKFYRLKKNGSLVTCSYPHAMIAVKLDFRVSY